MGGSSVQKAPLSSDFSRRTWGATEAVSRREICEVAETPDFRPSIRLRVKDSVTFYGNLKDSKDWQAPNGLLVSLEIFKGFHLNGGLTSTWYHGAAPGIPAPGRHLLFRGGL